MLRGVGEQSQFTSGARKPAATSRHAPAHPPSKSSSTSWRATSAAAAANTASTPAARWRRDRWPSTHPRRTDIRTSGHRRERSTAGLLRCGSSQFSLRDRVGAPFPECLSDEVDYAAGDRDGNPIRGEAKDQRVSHSRATPAKDRWPLSAKSRFFAPAVDVFVRDAQRRCVNRLDGHRCAPDAIVVVRNPQPGAAAWVARRGVTSRIARASSARTAGLRQVTRPASLTSKSVTGAR